MPESLSIGEVINLLRDDFPDISVSKIRFLESQGLIDPDRTSSGYRQFGHEDLARLRFILAQQRDHFLPLKVIKSKLTLWERGEEPSDEPGPPGLDDPGEPLDEGDLVKRSGLSRKSFSELVEAGLLRPIPGSTVFPAEAALVATEAKRLMDHGLEARHLRAIRLAVGRETDLLTQLAAPLLKAANPDARARARDLLDSCADSIRVIHRSLLTQELRQHLT
ncbi:MAG: MerR family transcriptional regulator [Actinobacteria bacterium]|nr:MerR family transcriptional regulator [Actinomycetota bacterium]